MPSVGDRTSIDMTPMTAPKTEPKKTLRQKIEGFFEKAKTYAFGIGTLLFAVTSVFRGIAAIKSGFGKLRQEHNMWQEDGDENIPVCNFRPKVLALIKVSDDDSIHECFDKLFLRFNDGEESEVFTAPLSELEGIEWLNKDIRCRLNPVLSPNVAKRVLADYVREAVLTVPTERHYRINTPGTHIIDGEPVFCTGGGSY